MNDLQKLYRIFRLLQLLSQPPYRTVPQLASLLDTSTKSVYRYLRLLEEVGYLIDKKEGNRYFLQLDFPAQHSFLDMDEAGYLNDLLWNAASGDPRREKILHKLNQQFTLRPLVQSTARIKTYEHIQVITAAIEAGRRVRIHNYLKADGSLSTRYVEPVEFMDGYGYLWCYDLDKKEYRQFKLDRMGDVEMLDESFESKHESRALDLFGWTGPKWLPVRLKLSPRAYQLLIEEYPDSRPFVRMSGGEAFFDGVVRDWRGIGRFILGLAGEIEVQEPEELRAYLRKRIKKSGYCGE